MITVLGNIGNVIQFTGLVTLVLYLLLQSRRVSDRYRSALYFMAGGYFCQAMGLVFWTLIQIIQNGKYPKFFSAYDVCSVGGFLFFISIYSVCLHQKIEGMALWKTWKLWVLPVVVFVNMTAWMFIDHNYAINLFWGICMIALAFYASYGILQTKKTGEKAFLPYYWSTVVFLVVDLILFVSPSVMYLIMDLILTIVLAIMAIMLVRGVKQCCI